MNVNRREFLKQGGLAGVSVGLGMISACTGAEPSGHRLAGTTKLRYRSNGQFKIVQFTDIHWQWANEKDLQTARLMGEILDLEQPDLVVLTGDSISGKDLDTAKAYEDAYANLTRPMVERGVRWAAVFGNHDDEGCMSRAEQMAVMRKIPYCLAERGPAELAGVGNYTLCLHDASGRHVRNVFYLLDSGAYAPKDIEGYAWISRGQINWFVEQTGAFEKQCGGKVPSLVFFHIPIPEYNHAFDARTYGVKQEDVCCSKVNSGFFAAMLEAGCVAGTFVGHDHVNDYEGKVLGIRLCYGRATGFNTYGKDGFGRGARVILLTEGERDFRTWVRVEGTA